jgi:hypothetical protein
MRLVKLRIEQQDELPLSDFAVGQAAPQQRNEAGGLANGTGARGFVIYGLADHRGGSVVVFIPSFSETRQISGFLEDRGRTMLKSQTNYRRRQTKKTRKNSGFLSYRGPASQNRGLSML